MDKKQLKKGLLVVFFTMHLSIVLFQAIWTTLDGYWNFHYDKALHIPVLNLFRQNKHTEPYYIFSGTNTGYGFYGIKTSTEKYFRATYLDTADNILKTDRYFGLSSSNGIARLGSYCSYLANYIGDTEKLIEADSLFTESIQNRIAFRRNYIKKSMKWIGKETAKTIPGCVSYKIELMTIVPIEKIHIDPIAKPELYVIQEGLFKTE